MKKLKFILILIPCIVLGQNDSITVSNLDESNRMLKGICKEINNIDETLNQLKDSLSSIQRFSEHKFETAITLNEENIKSIYKELVPKENKDSKFSLGEFISNAIVEAIGAFLGFGGAFWLYWLSVKREKKKEEDTEEKQRNDRNNYLGSIINASIGLIENQINGIKDCIETINKDPINLPLMPLFGTDDLERFKDTMNKPSYYHSFLNTFGNDIDHTKKYRNITSTADYFHSQFLQIPEMHSIKQKADYERKMKYKGMFDHTLRKCHELGKSHEKTNNQLFKDIASVLELYHKNMIPEKLETHQVNFVEPMKKIFLEKHFDEDYVRPILNELTALTHLYSEIEMQNLQHVEDLKQIIETSESTLIILKENSGELTSKLINGS